MGPILLAYDAGSNPFEISALKPINVHGPAPQCTPIYNAGGSLNQPMALWHLKTDANQEIALCDFASAGAQGTEYASWLPASHMAPPGATLQLPRSNAAGRPSPVLMHWIGGGTADETYEVAISPSRDMSSPVLRLETGTITTANLDLSSVPDGDYFWQVTSRNSSGIAVNEDGPRPLHISRTAAHRFGSVGPGELMLDAPLNGSGEPQFGEKELEGNMEAAPDRNGKAGGALRFSANSKLRYALPFFPERDYSFACWVMPEGPPRGLQQIFSAWCRGNDDPLRVVINGDMLYAKMEAAQGASTPGVKVEPGKWIHVAAVKSGSTLLLYINGKKAQSAPAPEVVHSMSTQVGIGFNPLFSGNENFTGCLSDAVFYARALMAEQIAELAARK